MSHVFPRHSKISVTKAVRGDGVYIIDANGKRYLDACAGAAVSCLGHSNRVVAQAVSEQLHSIAWAHSGAFTSEPAEKLADLLIERAPTGIHHVYFVSGGSEAIESSLKLVRQYFVETGQPTRSQVIARRQSYHGNTLGALATGGNAARKQAYRPLLASAMHHIDPCHFWRYGEPDETEQAYGLRAANQLENKILELGAQNVAAFVAEPVVGATLGAVPAAEGYFSRIRQICDHYGVKLILDEVMCGVGRTGTWFACEHDHVRPDVVCIAKGLGAGIQPIGAMLCSAELYQAIAQGSGFFQHGHTYNAHPAACAAGAAVVGQIESRHLLANVHAMGRFLQNQLHEKMGAHPNVGNIRGRGLFVGIELVADKADKRALDPNLKIHAKIKKLARDKGLMVYPMGGTIDGLSGDHILLAPPYIFTREHVQSTVSMLTDVVEQILPGHANR